MKSPREYAIIFRDLGPIDGRGYWIVDEDYDEEIDGPFATLSAAEAAQNAMDDPEPTDDQLMNGPGIEGGITYKT